MPLQSNNRIKWHWFLLHMLVKENLDLGIRSCTMYNSKGFGHMALQCSKKYAITA